MSESGSKPLLLNESIKDSMDPTTQPSKIGESVAASEGEDLSPTIKKIRRRYNILLACSGVWLLVAIVIIFALPPLIEMAIVEQAKEQVIMAPSN
jgi:hypothetical protein